MKLNVLLICLDDLFEVVVLIGCPVARREDFHFDPVGEASSGFDELADSAVVDAAFAHQASVVQHVSGWSHPIADVEADDTLACAFDFLLESGVPPNVINVGGNADPFVADLVEHVIALANGVHSAAAIGIHRVQWLDREFNAALAGVFDERCDAFGNVFAILDETELGFRTADKHDLWRADRSGFVEGFDVVVKCGLFLGGVHMGIEATAHERHRFEPVVVEYFFGFCERSAFKPLTPEANARHAGGGIFCASRRQIPRLGGHCVDGEAVEVVHKKSCLVFGFPVFGFNWELVN